MAVDNTGEVKETPKMEAWTNETKPSLQLPRIITNTDAKDESPNIVLARRILSCKLSDRVYGSVSTTEPFRQRLRKDVDDLVRSPTSLVLGSRSPQRVGESSQDLRGIGERQKSNLYIHGSRVDQRHDRDIRKGDDSGLGSSIEQKRVQCHFTFNRKHKYYDKKKTFSLPQAKDSVHVDNDKVSKSVTRLKPEDSTSKETSANPRNAEVLPISPEVLHRRRNTKEVLGNLCDHPAITRKILRELDEKSLPSKERTYEWLMKYTL